MHPWTQSSHQAHTVLPRVMDERGDGAVSRLTCTRPFFSRKPSPGHLLLGTLQTEAAHHVGSCLPAACILLGRRGHGMGTWSKSGGKVGTRQRGSRLPSSSTCLVCGLGASLELGLQSFQTSGL